MARPNEVRSASGWFRWDKPEEPPAIAHRYRGAQSAALLTQEGSSCSAALIPAIAALKKRAENGDGDAALKVCFLSP